MRRILVIDDDALTCELLSTILIASGFSVVVAANGREAILQNAAQPIDLIITDVVMPEMDGFELIRALRRADCPVPVIVISGNTARAAYLHMAELLGAVKTLAKPFTADDLLSAVKHALVTPGGAPTN